MILGNLLTKSPKDKHTFNLRSLGIVSLFNKSKMKFMLFLQKSALININLQ